MSDPLDTPDPATAGVRQSSPNGDVDRDLAGTISWRELAAETEPRLATARLANPSIDVRRMIERAAGLEPSEYHHGLDRLVTQRAMAHFDAMVARRLVGEPLQYVVGEWSFRTLDLLVDKRVLIPRPETELVAELALAEIDRQRDRWGPDETMRVADLGTGSGAIGLAIAAERDHIAVVCTDSSPDALAVASANAAGLGRRATAITVRCGSWFDALDPSDRASFHVVVSNPPYVSVDDPLPPDVADWEPTQALISADDGYADAFHLIDNVAPWLAAGGALVLELGQTQLDRAAARAEAAGFIDVATHRDLNDRPRVLVARTP